MRNRLIPKPPWIDSGAARHYAPPANRSSKPDGGCRSNRLLTRRLAAGLTRRSGRLIQPSALEQADVVDQAVGDVVDHDCADGASLPAMDHFVVNDVIPHDDAVDDFAAQIGVVSEERRVLSTWTDQSRASPTLISLSIQASSACGSAAPSSTTRDPDTGRRDADALREIPRYRGTFTAAGDAKTGSPARYHAAPFPPASPRSSARPWCVMTTYDPMPSSSTARIDSELTDTASLAVPPQEVGGG
jgi:hypothetical protein